MCHMYMCRGPRCHGPILVHLRKVDLSQLLVFTTHMYYNVGQLKLRPP